MNMDVNKYNNANDFKIKADVEIEEGKDYEYFITHVTDENVAMQGQKPEMKPTLWFRGEEKCFPLNKTNCRVCAQLFGSTDTDDWADRKVVLFRDLTSSPQGIVPCIRIRHDGAARATDAPEPVDEPKNVLQGEDDIQF
jgi:hypothetical protein